MCAAHCRHTKSLGEKLVVLRPSWKGSSGRTGANSGSDALRLTNRSVHWDLSGPLDRLNAILSLLQPLDRYRTPSAIVSAIGRPLSRPISHPNTVVGVLNRLVLNRLGGGLNRVIVVQKCLKLH